jgi:hypothetical protein
MISLRKMQINLNCIEKKTLKNIIPYIISLEFLFMSFAFTFSFHFYEFTFLFENMKIVTI